MSYYDDPKKVHIPVSVVNGQLTFDYNDQPFALTDGHRGELIIPASAVGDRLRSLLLRESVAEMFPAETILRVEVHPRQLSDVQSTLRPLLTELQDNVSRRIDGWLAPVLLEEPLQLRLRGSKQGELLPCAISIPGLMDSTRVPQSARSLNHACALLSTACEPHRASHTGNVFNKVYFVDPQDQLQLIDHRRSALETTALLEVIVLSQRWWLQDAFQLPRRWARWGQNEHGKFVVWVIDHKSIVMDQRELASANEVTAWLNSEGFRELDFEPEARSDWPPEPPYRLPTTGRKIVPPLHQPHQVGDPGVSSV